MKIIINGTGQPEETMTVSDLIEQLTTYPIDMPVLVGWEGQITCIEPARFSVEPMSWSSIKDDCLVIDVD